MSLIGSIVEIIEDRGNVSIEDLERMLPGFTRQQITHSLHHATQRGLAVCVKRGRGMGRGKGCQPSTFGPPTKKPEPVESLWQSNNYGNPWQALAAYIGARA